MTESLGTKHIHGESWLLLGVQSWKVPTQFSIHKMGVRMPLLKITIKSQLCDSACGKRSLAGSAAGRCEGDSHEFPDLTATAAPGAEICPCSLLSSVCVHICAHVFACVGRGIEGENGSILYPKSLFILCDPALSWLWGSWLTSELSQPVLSLKHLNLETQATSSCLKC